MSRARPRTFLIVLAVTATLAVALAGVRAQAQSWTESLRIAPITTPIDLRYRPVSDVKVTFGRIVVEQTGVKIPHPIERSVGTMRIDPAVGRLAVTIDFNAPQVPQQSDVEGARLRLLISPKGELSDVVWADPSGEPLAVEGSPILAELEQSLYLMLPRFPAGPVKTGDLLYDNEIDMGPVPGVLPVRVRGTVRGTAPYNGREALVVTYHASGKAQFDLDLTYVESGYELIDLTTGIVVSLAGEETFESPAGVVRWSYGFEAVFP